MNLLVVVDMDGYFTYMEGAFRGYLVDATVYRSCNIPALPAGLLMLADSGFPAGRCGQMPNIQGREVNM